MTNQPSSPRATDTSKRAEIRDLIAAVDRAWLDAEPERLADSFHERVVFEAPGFIGRIVGREDCLDSYRQFVDQATIDRFETGTPQVDVFGPTAVAVRSLDIEYTLANETHRERAHEAITLTRARRRGGSVWLIVWRLIETAEEQPPR
ncbi:MAG: nuclear transport factor 2 family protein [Acidobacteriota bacterium]